MASDGRVVIDVILEDSQVAKGVANLKGQLGSLDKDGGGKLSGISNGIKGIASVAAIGATAVAGIGIAIGGLAAPLVKAAANAKAMQAQFDQVFAGIGESATASLTKIAEETGILPERLKGSFTQMAAFAKTTGMETAEALSLTEKATLAAADSAAFYDQSIESVTENLQSFLKGNYENDAALGISSTETTRNAAANQLYGKSFNELSESQKQLTLLKTVEDGNKLSGALGQAARESDSLENQLGNLKQAWENLKALLGGPLLEPVIQGIKLLTGLIKGFDTSPMANAFSVVKDVIVGVFNNIKAFVTSFISENSAQLSQIGETFKYIFQSISDYVSFILDGMKAFWSSHGSSIAETVSSAFQTVLTVIQTVLNAVSPFIQSTLATIQQFWSENGTQILEAVTNIFNGIKAVIDFVMPAVKFLIEMVWTAIKQVITGALDVIMGAIKIFSGLFTGDFSKMWEGIKQLFKGAIDLIMGLMTLSFFGGIKTALLNLGKTGLSLIKGMWDDIAKLFRSAASSIPTIVGKMATAVVNFFKNIWTQGSSIFSTLKTFGTSTFEALKQAVIRTVSGLVTAVISYVRNLSTNFANLISSLKTSVVSKFNEIKTGIINKIKEIDLMQVGKDIVSGLINGIGLMVNSVKKKVEELASNIPEWAKKMLGIHSPSRVMKQIGIWTGQGLAIGIDSTQSIVEKSMEDIGYTLLDVMDNYFSQEKEITKKANADIAQIEKRSQEDINKIYRNAYSKKRKTTEDENIKIRRLQEDAAKKIADVKAKSAKDIYSLLVASQKEVLSEIESFIGDKKSLEQLSIIDEARIWEESIKLFSEGSDERIKAQQNYKKAVETVNNEIVSVNKNYQSQMQTINDDLIKQVDDLNKSYEDAVTKRHSSLLSFAGLFDEFKIEMTTSGTELLTNLQGQVDGFKTWQTEMDKLAVRPISDGLISELSDMGPKALPELLALNSLTDEQLTTYSNLFAEKSALARTQSEKELIGMKTDTETKIAELQVAATAKLSELQIAWETEIKAITQVTSTELSTLKQVGIDAGQGLLNGLASMQGPLITKAQEIANGIKAAIQSALDIHSPSRWMRDFVAGNMAKGFSIGVDKNEGLVTNAARRLGEMVKPDVVNKLRGVRADFGTLTKGSSITTRNNSNSNSYDQSKKMYNQITIQESTDTAKSVEKALRRLQFQF